MENKDKPGTEFEVELARTYGWPVFAVDEVGRGSIAGPVCVGIAVLDETTSTKDHPAVRDSKLMTKKSREAIVGDVQHWVRVVVGQASAQEVDEFGIMSALRLAGERALTELIDAGIVPAVVLLDGSYDWLSRAERIDDRLACLTDPVVPVVTRVKADRDCAVVAAASVVAKVHRDAVMKTVAGQGDPYGHANHAGYGTPAHLAAIREHGMSEHHRRSFCRNV